MITQYDKCIESARETFRAEERERSAQEYLDREKEGHKLAARVWFNLMEDNWPPENTEAYWQRVSEKCNETWNEYPDNELMHSLLLMMHEYIGKVSEKYRNIRQ